MNLFLLHHNPDLPSDTRDKYSYKLSKLPKKKIICTSKKPLYFLQVALIPYILRTSKALNCVTLAQNEVGNFVLTNEIFLHLAVVFK